MDTIENEAPQVLVDFLGNLAGVQLSDEERHAAFMLACTLPNSASLKEFVDAADVERVKAEGLPETVAQTLAPLAARLKEVTAESGWTSALFQASSNDVAPIRESDVLAGIRELEHEVDRLKAVVASIQRKLDGGSDAVTVEDLADRQRELLQAQDVLSVMRKLAAKFGR